MITLLWSSAVVNHQWLLLIYFYGDPHDNHIKPYKPMLIIDKVSNSKHHDDYQWPIVNVKGVNTIRALLVKYYVLWGRA